MSDASDDLALGPLVARVEAGEPLGEADLQQVERAADRQPESLDWQLCLAHALLNSDRPEPALAVLARVLPRAPDHPLVRLARARAFGALERYSEAAAELAHVLDRHPGHADALRALALVRLRAGAPAEAARLARRVLETDPTDEPARQILAEAEAQTSQAPQAPPADPFARDLRRSLRERGLKSTLDPRRDALLVELETGRVGRLSLPSLREAAAADLRGEAAFVEALVGSLSRLKAPATVPALDEVRERLFPALRPASFPEKAGPVLSRPGPAGLLWTFAVDHPGFVTFLPPQAAEAWGLAVDEIQRLAFENLDRAPVAPSRFAATQGRLSATADRWDVLAFDEGDGLDASRLLAPAHRALVAALHPGALVVALPTTGYALLAREGDAAATALLATAARADAARPDGFSASLYRLADGELTAAS